MLFDLNVSSEYSVYCFLLVDSVDRSSQNYLQFHIFNILNPLTVRNLCDQSVFLFLAVISMTHIYKKNMLIFW